MQHNFCSSILSVIFQLCYIYKTCSKTISFILSIDFVTLYCNRILALHLKNHSEAPPLRLLHNDKERSFKLFQREGHGISNCQVMNTAVKSIPEDRAD